MPLRLRVCGRRAAAGAGGGEGDGDVTVAGDAGITSGELGTDDSGLHGEDWPDDRGSEAMGEPRMGEASSGDTGPDGLGEARAGEAGPGEKGPDTLGETGTEEAGPVGGVAGRDDGEGSPEARGDRARTSIGRA